MEEKFNYEYSAKQQQEVEKIREKYMPESRDKMKELIALDRSVSRKGRITAVIMSVISALILGVGMCLCLVWKEYMTIGIAVGAVGIAGLVAVYPVYSRVVKRMRKKVAPQIMRLSDDIMHNVK